MVNTFGYKKIKSIEIMNLSEDGSNVTGNKKKIQCDCLAISGGWTPMVHMHTQSGGKLDFRDIDQVFVPSEKSENHINVGSCYGCLLYTSPSPRD